MRPFTFNRDRVFLASLYEAVVGGNREHYYISFGCYRRRNGRENWTGQSYTGTIPLAELLQWGVSAGFIQKVKDR